MELNANVIKLLNAVTCLMCLYFMYMIVKTRNWAHYGMLILCLCCCNLCVVSSLGVKLGSSAVGTGLSQLGKWKVASGADDEPDRLA